jgi:hypothetical protein
VAVAGHNVETVLVGESHCWTIILNHELCILGILLKGALKKQEGKRSVEGQASDWNECQS